MRIKELTFHNFRIYSGTNKIIFSEEVGKNLSIVAGKNGFGKTTFLTALVWGFYGRLMSQVEDKYRKDIKSNGGYEQYLKASLNNSTKISESESTKFFVEIVLVDVSIPSIPCEEIIIRREFDYGNQQENLVLLIDGNENELTKEVGYDIFINDFILPREIAKFFFFDAEKIVSLAEAKSKNELRNLSKAYSEVLGIKKYEELRRHLESLLTNLRKRGVSDYEKEKLEKLEKRATEIRGLIDFNQDKQDEVDLKITELSLKRDNLQEKLIREGNAISLEELKELKSEREKLKSESQEIKTELKKMLEFAPFVIAGGNLLKLHEQLVKDHEQNLNKFNLDFIREEFKDFTKEITKMLESIDLGAKANKDLKNNLEEISKERLSKYDAAQKTNRSDILLDFSDVEFREFQSFYNYLKTSFQYQFNQIVQKEKDSLIKNKIELKKLNSILNSIKN